MAARSLRIALPLAFLLLATAAAAPFQAGAVDANVAGLSGCLDPEAAVAMADERYAHEPGFVYSYAVTGAEPRIVLVFDAAQRAGLAAPDTAESLAGHLLEVSEETFIPLIAPREIHHNITTSEPIPTFCQGKIQPGSSISTPVGGCTLAFIVQDEAGDTYATTAGHCFSVVGQRMTVRNLGQVGTVVWFLNAGVGKDAALVKIDANKVHLVDPAMCHWGGPTSDDFTATTAKIVRHTGFGLGYGSTSPTQVRSGVGVSGVGASFTFAGTVISGDSGSSARVDHGEALGIITHVNGGAVVVGHSAPFGYGTRWPEAVRLMEAATGLELTLMTADITPSMVPLQSDK